MGHLSLVTVLESLILSRLVPLLIKMRGFSFLFSVSLLFSVTKADFAAELATFVNETPSGFIVEKMIQNGETCHCRVPDELESSASSVPFATILFGSSSAIATTPGLAADAATTNPTTTNPTTTVPTTTWTTTGTTGSAGGFGSAMG